ncbi:insulinase family protein [Sphingomonas sp. CGMCC 1.13654]|uniref:Insulinase family protein n=1 Tax=Sphingomonas chungangi TaxID=2683589 RepID=A0A838L3B6_9SPHN|nr:pitrilysin family protein [Sphingomonas chungangi]MBA2932716.1 insulinase family protein [Sphingomonas chungangi]MVW56338.1 insulinase family protein [Sphingomonas chungangi]
MRLAIPALLFASALSPLSAAPPSTKPAPLSVLADQVKLPYEQFTLANGLRVVVSTDRKAPVVGVSVWYHAGSKDEPAGKTGFAHLFEHLMFNGSENAPGDFFKPLESVGATDYNGTTSFDRTNFFETVPTGALPLALFLESDRMGHLLGAVGQETLDRQRGVVQNEKRQDDNQPYGLVQYAEQQALFPDGHPYQHTTIGSMADLDHASLADVREWFRGHYGPNNAVLVLSGDIDAATARPLVEKYFGDIPRGPQPLPTMASVPTLKARKDETIHDQVATTRLYRQWAVPGLTDPDSVPLDIAASVLGGLASSRLDNALVRKEHLAVSVSANVEPMERVGEFEVQVDVRPGVDPKLVGQRLDAIIADLIATGPTADEIQRAVTQEIAGRIFGLEKVGGFSGRAAVLAQGAVYANDPGFYEKQLKQYANETPASVKAALQKWLTRPVYALTVAPGARAPYEEAKAVQEAEKPIHGATEVAASGAAPATGPKRIAPPVGDIAALTYPAIARATLSNGLKLVYAQRTGLPLTRLAITFDGGFAADPKGKLGTATLMLSLLDEGTPTRGSADIASEQEHLGSRIAAGGSMDRSEIDLAVLTPNLAPGMDLLADVTLHPTFAEIDRVRGEQLAGIESEMSDPEGLASRTLPGLIYGPGHPYGVPASGSGDPAAVTKLTKADLVAFKDRWLRPSDTSIFIVSDLPLGVLRSMLESRFGAWKNIGPAGAASTDSPLPAPKPRIVLLDRPGSPQSVIQAGEVLGANGTDELLPLIAANDALGGSFLSRLNMDIRETKAWSYGVQAGISRYAGRVPYLISAPVQTDKTGASIQAMLGDIKAFLTTQPLTDTERERTVERNIRQLPGSFETGTELLDAMQRNDLLRRPDDYYTHIADKYRALTTDELNTVARRDIRPNDLVWVVVGDAAKVKPQLDTLGLPVEVVKAPAAQ